MRRRSTNLLIYLTTARRSSNISSAMSTSTQMGRVLRRLLLSSLGQFRPGKVSDPVYGGIQCKLWARRCATSGRPGPTAWSCRSHLNSAWTPKACPAFKACHTLAGGAIPRVAARSVCLDIPHLGFLLLGYHFGKPFDSHGEFHPLFWEGSRPMSGSVSRCSPSD